MLFNVAPGPYMSGVLASGASKRFNLRPVIPPDLHDNMDFKEKVAKGFEVSLQSGVDILIAMTSVLVKMGNDFSRQSKNGNLLKHLLYPRLLYRFATAWRRGRPPSAPAAPSLAVAPRVCALFIAHGACCALPPDRPGADRRKGSFPTWALVRRCPARREDPHRAADALTRPGRGSGGPGQGCCRLWRGRGSSWVCTSRPVR